MFSQLLAEDDEFVIRQGYEIRTYVDGTTRTVPFRLDREAKPAKRSFDSATLIRPTRWDHKVKLVKFNFTEFASDFKKNVKKAANKYHNTKRGNGLVPRIKTTSAIDKVKDISTFNNPWEFYSQFTNDDKNTIVMTEDDQFFKSPNGFFFDPNLMAKTKIYSIASFEEMNGRYEGAYYLEDADIELRSDFFDMPSNQQNIILAGAFKFAMGYQISAWAHDINGENNPFVDINALKNKNSDVWKKMMHQWDNFYYQDKLTATPAAFHTVPQVMPFDGEVIDIADYETPLTDDDAVNPAQVSQTLFLTNLKGFDGVKKLNITLTQITKKNNKDVKKKILALSGNAYDYPITLLINGKSTKAYPTIWFNGVILGNESDLNKLKTAIKKSGTPMELFGKTFDKALKVEVVFNGRLTQNEAVKSKKMTYYFINSDD